MELSIAPGATSTTWANSYQVSGHGPTRKNNLERRQVLLDVLRPSELEPLETHQGTQNHLGLAAQMRIQSQNSASLIARRHQIESG